MKNIRKWFMLFVATSIISVSCSKSETYADKVKAERKQISHFMAAKDFVEISTYPSDGVFKDNEFFKDPVTGVYINVIDSGNGLRASQADMADVYMRFWETATLPFDDSKINSTNDDATGNQPLHLVYGNSNTYKSSNSNDYYNYIYLSPALVAPLRYVGENAIIRLIIPFSQGSSYQNAAYQPIYFGRLKYTRIIN